MSREPHQHGGEVAKALARYGVSPRPVVDFSVNLSPLGPPASLTKIWPQLADEMSRYPDPQATGIKEYYQHRYGLDPRRVVPLNGSIEGLYLWPRAVKATKILLPIPSFYDYQAGLEACEVTPHKWVLSEDNHFSLNLLPQQLDGHDGVILGSPNNPTGKAINRKQIQRWLVQFPKVQFLVDQAFVELSDVPDQYRLFDLEAPNLWILHSLTKEFAIPGLRAGALICPAGKAQGLEEALPPWRVSGACLQAVKQLEQQEEYTKQLRALLDVERERVFSNLHKLPWLTLSPTNGNFFLAKLSGGPDLDKLLTQALIAGIFLRDARNFEGLTGDYLRFAIRTGPENDLLIHFFTHVT